MNSTARARLTVVKDNAEIAKVEPHVLTSWKEVAAYLGKGVRTVQRWERELALPVRRPYGSEKHVIVALPEELDKWMRTKMQTRELGGGVPEAPTTIPITQIRTSDLPPARTDHSQQLERLRRLMRVMAERTAEVQRASAQLVARAAELTRDSEQRQARRISRLEPKRDQGD